MRNLWTQAAAHWLRLTLLWRSGHVSAALFYFCAAQQTIEIPDANMLGTWKHIIANRRPGKETSRIDRTAIPTSPFGLKNMRSGRATAQQAGMDFSSSFRPYRRVRFHLPSVPVRPKNFADRTGKARTHEYASEPESSLLSSPSRPGENGKQSRRQGKTQLLTTVSRAASPEAASPFFRVT